jgi:ribose-phosphate pyrophosphokinase
MAIESDVMIFSGSGSRYLTTKICSHLGVPVCKSEVLRFSEGNTFVRVRENVRGRDVYLVQSTAFPVNDNFMELLFWIDAFKRASAEKVTVLLPYFSYAKGDKKDEPRVSIRARVCADAIEAAGADRVVTMDLHAPQIQGFFKIPVDDLYALPILCDAVMKEALQNLVVVSPDAGFTKKARNYADYLGVSIAIANKSRKSHNEKAEILEIIGDVRQKTALLVDDFTISAGTLVNAASKLIELGASKVMAMVTHGVFSLGAREKIDRSNISKLFITDTIETQPEPLSSKVEVVSVAPLFGDAIRRIHDRKSISVLFERINPTSAV